MMMTSLFLESYKSLGMPFLEQSCTHIKTAFSVWDKKVFHKTCKVFEPAGKAAVMTSRIPFLFYHGPYAGFIHLEVATTAADLNLRYIPSNWTFSCNVMTSLLGSTASITGGTLWVPGLQYYTKHDEKYARTARDCFSLWHAIHWRNELLALTGLVSRVIVSRHLATVDLTALATGRWLWNYCSSVVCPTVNLMQLWCNTASLFAFLSIAGGVMYGLCVCVSILTL